MFGQNSIASRIALLCGAIALGWIVLFISFAEDLAGVLGDAAYALTLLSLFVTITSLVVLVYLRHIRRIRRSLLTGTSTIAHWHVSEPEWHAFVAQVQPEAAASRHGLLGAVLLFSFLVPVGTALVFQKDFTVLASIGLVIALTGLFGNWLGKRIEARRHEYHRGEVTIGAGGMLVNGTFHCWAVVGSQFEGVEVIRDAPPRLKVRYSYWTRTGRQCVDVDAPIAQSAIVMASAAAAALNVLGQKSSRDAGSGKQATNP